MLEKIKCKPRVHEENPIFKFDSSYSAKGDRCGVKYIFKILDIPYNKVMERFIDNYVKTFIEWFKTNKKFLKETKDELLLWPFESKLDTSYSFFTFPRKTVL